MRTGEIWTLQDDLYASKPRPVVILQAESISSYESLIVCLLTSHKGGSDNRVEVAPSKTNGLEKVSYVMTEKLAAVPKGLLGIKVGALDEKTFDVLLSKVAIIMGIKQRHIGA
jgi:mRNA interferase MazF